MQPYIDAIRDAFGLIANADSYVWEVILLSLAVSGSAIVIATVVGVPLGYSLGLSRRSGRGILVVLVNTAMSFPPVVIGMFVYIALSRSGFLRQLGWLMTPQGMVLAQVLLATPLVIGVTSAAISGVSRDLRVQLRALGASKWQEGMTVLKEARAGVLVAIIAGFGAIISEVGAVSIVGGGIEHQTEVMTTAIMANVRRGDNSTAMAWAMVLMGIALMVNIVLASVQNAGSRYDR